MAKDRATRDAGLALLDDFRPLMGRSYAEHRNTDRGPGRHVFVSRLSPYLRRRLVTEQETVEAALADHGPEAADAFIREVFWRGYFKGWLERRPQVWTAYVDGLQRDLAAAAADPALADRVAAAEGGRTGLACFDAWAQELTATGYLHNHARMWFASIWIFTLKLDWRLGADFFLRHLMDADAASNTLSWRWVAGLHTKGKHYLARADNIARYTSGRPEGALAAARLAGDEAEPLTEPQDYARQKLDLPAPVSPADLARPFALLLHDEAAHHAPLALPTAPALVIAAARPEARSPGALGSHALGFAQGALAGGMAEAAAAFACPAAQWRAGEPLAPLLAGAGVERIAMPYVPAGWTRDAIAPDLAPLAAKGRVVTLLGDLDRATWPLAKAGFFGVAKAIDSLLAECGIAGHPAPASTGN